jgi:hypothetical protein
MITSMEASVDQRRALVAPQLALVGAALEPYAVRAD